MTHWLTRKKLPMNNNIRVINNIDALEDSSYEAILVAVAHQQFQDFDYARYLTPQGIIYDVKGQVESSCMTYKL